MKRSTTSRHTCKTLPHNLHHSKFQLCQGLKNGGRTLEVLGGNIEGRVSLEQWHKKHKCGSRSAMTWEKMRLKGGRQEAPRERAGATKPKDAYGQHGALMRALTLMGVRSQGWSRRDHWGGHSSRGEMRFEPWEESRHQRAWGWKSGEGDGPRKWNKASTTRGTDEEHMAVKWSEERRGDKQGSISLLGSGAGVFTEPQRQLQGFVNEGWQLSADALDSVSHRGLDQFFDPG